MDLTDHSYHYLPAHLSLHASNVFCTFVIAYRSQRSDVGHWGGMQT